MSNGEAICLNPRTPAVHVDVRPGGEIIVKGSFYSAHDGSTIDAAATIWPENAPGGASADSGGLIDFAAGGFRVTDRNLKTHEVHAIATGDPSPACDALRVASPCLPMRTVLAAQSRLLTVDEWSKTLKGGTEGMANCLVLEVPSAVLPPVAPKTAMYLQWAGGIFVFFLAIIAVFALRKRQQNTPQGRLLALAKRVQNKLSSSDAVLRAPLSPAIESALKAVAGKKVDPAGSEGKRVEQALLRVEMELDSKAKQARAEQEQEAADELLREMESALEAAEEASAIGAKLNKSPRP